MTAEVAGVSERELGGDIDSSHVLHPLFIQITNLPNMSINNCSDVIGVVQDWLLTAGFGDVAQAKADALEEFAAKWNRWIMADAPQVRGGAGHRARAEAAKYRTPSANEGES